MGEMRKDVMIFTPVYRLEPETVLGLFALEWEGAITLLLQRDNPNGNPYLDHLHQYQRGRELFLASRCSALLVIESDILPPRDALRKLWAVLSTDAVNGFGERIERIGSGSLSTDLGNGLSGLGADVVYGVYVFRDGGVVNVLEKYYADQPGRTARNTGESLTVRGLYQAAVKKGIVECSGSGLGCVLMRREVVEKAPFEGDGTHFFDCDWTETVYRQGWRMKAEMTVRCGHKRDGVTAWPEG